MSERQRATGGMSQRSFPVRTLVPGRAHGPVLLCTSEIPGWGGIDPRTGNIVEVGHPQRGRSVAGTVLVMPGAKGSSGWSGQLHLAQLQDKAPAAIVTRRLNAKLALTLAVLRVPAVMDVPEEAYALLRDGCPATVADGALVIHDD
ncbi:DUF126 domain-containing protein [Nocardioides sp. DS6]|uniref:DUF126 domain-containing protein n=1 Tax=Nocardioides eburneus TaxID=3231482 RepID=A0ABV3T2K8_9ACTN